MPRASKKRSNPPKTRTRPKKRSKSKKRRGKGLQGFEPKGHWFYRGNTEKQLSEFVDEMFARGCDKVGTGSTKSCSGRIEMAPTGSYSKGGPGRRTKVWVGRWCCPRWAVETSGLRGDSKCIRTRSGSRICPGQGSRKYR